MSNIHDFTVATSVTLGGTVSSSISGRMLPPRHANNSPMMTRILCMVVMWHGPLPPIPPDPPIPCIRTVALPSMMSHGEPSLLSTPPTSFMSSPHPTSCLLIILVKVLVAIIAAVVVGESSLGGSTVRALSSAVTGGKEFNWVACRAARQPRNIPSAVEEPHHAGLLMVDLCLISQMAYSATAPGISPEFGSFTDE